MPRYPITPLTEKYFVYICSSFREKSGTCFKSFNCNDDQCNQTVQELANLCSTAFFSFESTKNSDFSTLKNVVKGSIYSNCWAFINNFNVLSLGFIEIICKEIQILEQKYILAEINNENEIQEKIIIRENEDNFELKNKSFPSLEQKKLLKDHLTSNSDLNSNYFLKYKSLEGAEEENLNFGDNLIKQEPIPSIKKKPHKELDRVAHGLFITYNYNPIQTLSNLSNSDIPKEESLKSCFR